MQVIECSGSPYEVGFQHGKAAAEAVARSIGFYTNMFRESSKLSWNEALERAKPFESNIREKWPAFHEEMRGIADGAAREVLEIVTLNVRTELAFGLGDGCTSAYCHNHEGLALLGQNWDWMPAQSPNLLIMTISRPNLPTIKMVTEAGLIGKIGLNSAGVGVCFNALRIRGISPTGIPAHLALRIALESRSAGQAATAIEAAGGLASAAYILVGDQTGAIGLECTSNSLVRQTETQSGTIVHANHLLYVNAHPKAQEDIRWVQDSSARVQRMNTILSQFILPQKLRGKTRMHQSREFEKLFEDEHGYPKSICRAAAGESTAASLFNIVMDLEQRAATVREGRPCDKGKQHVLQFGQEPGASARL